MPPIEMEVTRVGGMPYGNPFVGPINHTAPVRVDVSALSATQVDDRGYLKASVFLKRDGTPIGVGEAVYGLVVEPVKVAASNAPADLAAAVDIDVAVAVICAVNRQIVEDIHGRALTADELASVGVAGASPIVLIY